MQKITTKSSGIRMPTELYSWIDNRAARRKITRSQCICDIVKNARKRSVPRSKPNQAWALNAAKVGEYFSVGIILVDFQCMFGLI